MKNFNRRQWLKAMGLTGVAVASGTMAKATNTPSPSSAKNISEIGQPVRLTSNENPYAPAASVKKAMHDAMDLSFRYPVSHYKVLLEKLAKKEGVPANHILLTSGSNEGLRVVGLTYGLNSGEIIAGIPTYRALLSYAEEIGAYINQVPLNEQLEYDLGEIEKRINTNTKLIFLCNPNNPTGGLLDSEEVKAFCKSACKRTMVFSDEAYYDYVTDKNYPSMVHLVKDGYNVIVSKTFSKVYGFAGVRVGYLIARPDIIQRLRPKVMSYVNMMGVYGAAAALDDQEFYDYSLEMNDKARKHIYSVCDDLKLEYVPSHANFVFIKTGRDVRTFAAQMQEQNVLVGRPFEPLTNWCRVSTSTMEDMAAWERAIRKVIKV
ncbi:MAG: histidinol-phosphate transaminase [Bacteroidota bacterium]